MKTKFQLSSIKRRAIMFITISMIVVSTIASLIIFQSMTSSSIKKYETDKEAELKSIPIALAQSMELYDYNEIERLITAKLSFGYIKYIAVFAKNGTLIRSATFKNIPKENLEFVSTNIESNGENIGTVEIGFSKQYIYDMVNAPVRPLIFGWLLMMFILVFVIYFWANAIIIKPLNHLSKETEKISKGDFSVRAKLQRNDEIGILSNNFNRMAENLAASYNKLKHLNLTLRSMRNVNQLITKERDADRLIKRICDDLTENYGYPMAGISLIDKSGKVTKTVASGSDKMLQKMIKEMKQGKFPDCIKKALQQREPVIIEDPASTCGNCLLMNQCEGIGMVVVQLLCKKKLYGIIYIRLSHEFIKNDEEISLFKEIADDIAFGLYRIELEEKDKALLKKEIEQHRQVETFTKVLLALVSKTTLNDVFDEILNQAKLLVPHDTSNIALIKGNALYNVCWKGYKKYGMEELIANTIQPLDEYKIPGAAIKAKKILVISDTTKEPDWILLKETAWIKSHIAVPIILQNRVLGMLRIDSEIPNKFSKKDAKKLESLANAAAVAIEKARLLEKEQRLQAETLAKITIALTSKSTLNGVFDEILKQANLIVPSDASRINLIKNDIVYTAYQKGYEKYGIKEFIANLKMPIKEYKIPGKAIKEKKILMIPDTAKEPDWVLLKETAWEKSHAIVPIILQNHVLGVLTMISETPNKFSKEDAKKLQSLANAAAIAIEKARLLEKTRKEVKQREKAEKNVKENYGKLQKTMQGTIFTLAKIVEMKDPYTAGHQRHVAQLSEIIAKEMKFSKNRIETLKTAALLHDIGKINIPSEILTKPTKLLPIEFSLIKEHPLNGYEMLKNIEFPGPVKEIALQHHERMDGSGYPNGLKGNEIMLEARILAVADVVEAMSSHRPYRSALGIDKALEEIEKNKGILYDSKVVDICVRLFKEKRFKFKE